MTDRRDVLLLCLAALCVEGGLSYGHLLQAAGKRELTADRLMHFHTRVLGPYRVGAGVPEVVGLLGAAAATGAARHDAPVARRSGAALTVTAAAFGVWAAGIQQINARLSTWHPWQGGDDVPPDWASLRERWHRPHGARLGLLLAGAAATADALRVSWPAYMRQVTGRA